MIWIVSYIPPKWLGRGSEGKVMPNFIGLVNLVNHKLGSESGSPGLHSGPLDICSFLGKMAGCTPFLFSVFTEDSCSWEVRLQLVSAFPNPCFHGEPRGFGQGNLCFHLELHLRQYNASDPSVPQKTEQRCGKTCTSESRHGRKWVHGSSLPYCYLSQKSAKFRGWGWTRVAL